MNTTPPDDGPQAAGVPDNMPKAERLAFALCLEADDDPHTLDWEGNPPEPWGDRWMRYLPQAERLLKLMPGANAARALPEPAAPADTRICHAPGDRCHGCAHYRGEADVCVYAPADPAVLTDEQMRDLVKECGLDWQRGYMPLFDGDSTNRYAVLIEAAIAAHKAATEGSAKP